MSVAGSPRRSPSCRWRKRHRPGADWWGPPVRFIVDQGCGYLFTCFGISLLVVVLWCVGNPDLWDRGLVCFWGIFLLWLAYPNLPIAWAQARARITLKNGGFPVGFPFDEAMRVPSCPLIWNLKRCGTSIWVWLKIFQSCGYAKMFIFDSISHAILFFSQLPPVSTFLSNVEPDSRNRFGCACGFRLFFRLFFPLVLFS